MVELSEALSEDLGRLMYALTTKYRGHEKELGLALTRSLALFIAVSTKDTRGALDAAAEVLRQTPFNELKREHFGHSLGLDKTVEAAKVGEVFQLGMHPKFARRSPDGGPESA